MNELFMRGAYLCTLLLCSDVDKTENESEKLSKKLEKYK